jgi:hypothetical protein
MPRDIVYLGNELTGAVMSAREAGERLGSPVLRQVVSRAAAGFAEEQLQICANQIIADQRLEKSMEGSKATALSSYELDSVTVMHKLINFIECIGSDAIEREDFLAACELAHDEFGAFPDVMSVLWQNGIIGYAMERDSGRWHFYALGDDDHSTIPLIGDRYAFWTAVTDLVPNLRIVTPDPILPSHTSSS